MTTWSDHPAPKTREYVTEISVPDFGDGGIQRLHSKPLGGKGDKEMPETGSVAPDTPGQSQQGFYGWHAEWGHAPEIEEDGGVTCNCGETFRQAGPEAGS